MKNGRCSERCQRMARACFVSRSKEGKIFRSVSIRIEIDPGDSPLRRSTVWNRISAEEKERLRLHKRDDGEFWMSLDDFIDNFTEIQICHQGLAGFANDFSVRCPSRPPEESVSVEAIDVLTGFIARLEGDCLSWRLDFWLHSGWLWQRPARSPLAHRRRDRVDGRLF